MSAASTQQLDSCERRYREIARKLAEIGDIASGSVAHRFSRCGKASCACQNDPSRLHGPYWLFTAKVNGRTVNKRLTERQAGLYQQWIGNDRKARALLAEMRAIAAEAQSLILAEEPAQSPRTSSPESRRTASRPRS